MNSEETEPKLVADTDEDQESVNALEDNESSAFSEKNVRLGKGRFIFSTSTIIDFICRRNRILRNSDMDT